MTDYDEIIDLIEKQLHAAPLHPPAGFGSVRDFLKEFRRIGAESELEFCLAAFQPFWKALGEAVEATRSDAGPPVGKWRLRTRVSSPASAEEVHARIKLHAVHLLGLARTICDPAAEDFPEESYDAQLKEAAVGFAKALNERPDILIKADASEISHLKTMIDNLNPSHKDSI